jgi:DNA-directed RNA polymerase specialized sigma24 family protein
MFGWNSHRRLSTINTQWSVVLQAARGHDQQAALAQLNVLANYLGVVERYLRGALRDDHAAEELAQEFVLRLIRGDFGAIDPNKGRFRDYLKTVLFRMVAQRQRERSLAGVSLEVVAEPMDTVSDDPAFNESWRNELIEMAWRGLRDLEKQKGKPFNAVLLHSMSGDGEVPPDLVAAKLSLQFKKKYSASYVRKLRERARDKFAEILLAHVQNSLDQATDAAVEHELRSLGLWPYCRRVLGAKGKE